MWDLHQSTIINCLYTREIYTNQWLVVNLTLAKFYDALAILLGLKNNPNQKLINVSTLDYERDEGQML